MSSRIPPLSFGNGNNNDNNNNNNKGPNIFYICMVLTGVYISSNITGKKSKKKVKKNL